MIRSHIQSFIPSDKIYHLYIPQIAGKEKRKKAPSKAGTLGVEGMEFPTGTRLLSRKQIFLQTDLQDGKAALQCGTPCARICLSQRI